MIGIVWSDGRSVFNARRVRLMLAVLLMTALWSLSACSPAGAAVGDTQSTRTVINHDSVDQADIVIGVVGSDTAADDSLLMTALANGHLNAFYAATSQTVNPVQAAASSVDDMIDRAVKAIVIVDPDISGDSTSVWHAALLRARDRGIPVVLVGARKLPTDDRLYAAALTIDNGAKGAIPFDTVMMQVINDRPHGVRVTVSTVR